MKTEVREMARYAIDELREEELMEVLDFIHYLRWRREEMDQSWFWTAEWQAHCWEVKADFKRREVEES